MRRAALAPMVAAAAAAVLLSGVATYTVQRSGCDDPGYYVTRDGAIELVGGCLEPGDLPVGPVQTDLDTPQDGTLVRP